MKRRKVRVLTKPERILKYLKKKSKKRKNGSFRANVRNFFESSQGFVCPELFNFYDSQ